MKRASAQSKQRSGLRSSGSSGRASTEPQPSLWEFTASELLERISSTEPTPGGGSVAIVTASMGTALLRKALAVSMRKEHGAGERLHELEETLAKLSGESQVLEESADQDAAGFDSYISALRLPRGSAAEVELREKAVEDALVRATLVPLGAAVAIQNIVALALRELPLIHDVILSDAVAGLRLLHASSVCLLFTAESNLPGMAKSPARPALEERLRELTRTNGEMESKLERGLVDRGFRGSSSGARPGVS